MSKGFKWNPEGHHQAHMIKVAKINPSKRLKQKPMSQWPDGYKGVETERFFSSNRPRVAPPVIKEEYHGNKTAKKPKPR